MFWSHNVRSDIRSGSGSGSGYGMEDLHRKQGLDAILVTESSIHRLDGF